MYLSIVNKISYIGRKSFIISYHSRSGVYGFRERLQDLSFNLPVETIENRIKNFDIYQLTTAFRNHGHKIAMVNPLYPLREVNDMELDPSQYGLDVNSSKLVHLDGIFHSKKSVLPISKAIKLLREIYCGYIGVEYQYLCEEERNWFSNAFEKMQQECHFTDSERKKLAIELMKSQVFDNFLATKFSSVKRYSGEGAESMMGFFSEVFRNSAYSDVSNIVIGCPHRGRLNLLTGLLGFPPVAMFQKMKGYPEFPDTVQGTGDVLSHLTSSVDLEFEGHCVHITMLPNPSHLEAVSPVVVGKCRGLLQSLCSGDYAPDQHGTSVMTVLPIQVHGDASFTGQGVIMETLAMSNAPHFSVGGSLHLIVNNQIGFTTPQERGRSSMYCSDIMKMISAPVIHVNGDFPEEVVKATRLALGYRNKFHKDVLVDMMCFRRWGHNELDDPTFTNPLMYTTINSRKSVPDIYSGNLTETGVWNDEEKNLIVKEYSTLLNDNLKQIDSYKPEATHCKKRWLGLIQPENAISKWDTGLPVDLLKFIGFMSVKIPSNVKIHPTLGKHFVYERQKRLEEGVYLDWATAEAMAIGSLLYQGHNVRLSGQDVGRGTFSHRHAVLVDQSTDEVYVPLNHIVENQSAHYEVANSLLSEEGVLSFEYGFSIVDPNNLVIWEAQFGDFFNAAQVVFDTFIASGETKWLLQCGIVILLPHGYDGAGPEHSSCRIERFLQMCDSKEDAVDGDNINWSIVHPTTPAQYFHLLRRQIIRNYRKPMVVVAPKILLRHPQAVSTVLDMAPGTSFIPVLGDNFVDPPVVKKVIFCSGKHFYLLQKERESRKRADVALIRLEALCPFPAAEISDEFKKYKNVQSFIWSQEEHQNMGPWSFVKTRFENILGCHLKYAGRRPLATPAVGIGQVHQREIKEILNEIFD